MDRWVEDDLVIAAVRRSIAREVFAEVFQELGEPVVAELTTADLIHLLVDRLDGLELWTQYTYSSRSTKVMDLAMPFPCRPSCGTSSGTDRTGS